ncbi:MAG: hypothetical protein IKL55_02550 [Clostridia bacterium]|nr:hypothetical protein [Clostridia bacterium]
MKKILKITGIIGILLMLIISKAFATEKLVDANSEALDLLSSSNLNFSDEEIINTDIFLAEDNISLKNTVNGNVYVCGETVEISSENIDGDVFVIGENVIINSNITGNIYVLATNLSLEGNMKDTFIITETMNFNENAVCRDIKVLGANINVDGTINRDLYAATGMVNVSNTGKIGGLLSCPNEVTSNIENINQTQVIKDAAIDFKQLEYEIEELMKTLIDGINLFLFLSSEMTGLIIIALIVLFTSKKQINNSELKVHGLMDTVFGLLYFGVAILVIIALVFTLIGIPVSLLLCLFLWFIFWKITIPVASIQIAKTILKLENKPKVLVWFIAFLMFTLVQCTVFIPTIGGLIRAIVSLYGFGYMIRSVMRKNKTEDIDSQVEII